MSADRGSKAARKTTGTVERDETRGNTPNKRSEKDHAPANSAPDAVKDPNEKTDGKPGLPQGRDPGETDVDPGAG